ncbi:MAG: ADP-ribosylglycohydrolase family protein [Salinispira sp.]
MNRERVKAAMYGTLAADAAAMGLHWIYSQGKIAAVVKKHGGEPEFLEPDRENYKGVPSFFAHPLKKAGDGSNYGSYYYVLFKSIEDGNFSVGNYIRAFQEYYGIGGEYVGYADTPMRETIFNITTISKSIQKKVMETSSDLPDNKKDIVAGYIGRYFFEHTSDDLKATIKNALKLHEFSRNELALVDSLVDAVADIEMTTGTDDDQMPGLTRSAFFAYVYNADERETELERAVRITNDNDLCVAHAVFMARVLADLYDDAARNQHQNTDGSAIQECLRQLVIEHLDTLPSASQKLIRQAMDYPALNYRDATKTFGAACHVDMAVPLCLHILLNTGSFTEAARVNILASGDTCGRAVFLGALAGAMYGIKGALGIPETWLNRTTLIPMIDSFGVL